MKSALFSLILVFATESFAQGVPPPIPPPTLPPFYEFQRPATPRVQDFPTATQGGDPKRAELEALLRAQTEVINQLVKEVKQLDARISKLEKEK